ncbi:MAG: peptidyl-dipeptidase [Henriciella sp.]|jgi:peptidyl-dipeptidase A|uniref:M2 family metallopeptidase n=1 Tax=Henriciella sp. TaxID=1968823 RepID=UPI000C0FA8AF|nr:M2 family metallopeptidase [Henriciella sp.]MAN74545.1 peptidyl-dipeptidase [Henriciella sp.]MBF32657.1 peptidyl-dipeptidase [Hyphomonadaceae bacterium]PHR69065.1 MAG: peptidyl-dipeptidase [Henriciella sp.]|tara:strand:- start:175 stop:2049 length:1875 start_codon:yes stop_codon:yes gene_type:complete
MKKSLISTSVIALGTAMLVACSNDPGQASRADAPASPMAGDPVDKENTRVAEARAFLERADAELGQMSKEVSPVFWEQATNITDETNAAAAEAGARATTLAVSLANESKQFNDVDLPPDLARKMKRLQSGVTIPAPSSEGAAEELSKITTGLEATYGTGTFTYKGEELNLDQLSTIIETSRDPAELKVVWEGWRTVSPPMKDDYARMVEIANEGAQELGYDNLKTMWLSKYDMPPEEMAAEVDRLWGQVEPLYEQLHCYVRAELNEEYGDAVQPANGPIRADLLGNMWSQSWSNIYPLVQPEGLPGQGYDLTEELVEADYTPIRMVETAEGFFTSLGLAPLPETFWERSMIVRPDDREVVCHASAWDLDDEEDVRIKMCTEVNAEDFYTVHHELGHNYYQRAYKDVDYLYKDGAHDGFHEAIGDFIALSITPSYLVDIGLITEEQVPGEEADISLLMNTALDKIAFLPFALTVDSWRWDVLDGTTMPADYNEAWWDKRTHYQGIVPPGPRPADAFDPGAKYHIPGNTPYLRYFLSYIMQFQFHKAACEQAGWEGPLHRCSIYGNEEVGSRFNAMMEMGASEPWPDVLETFTGTREMDGSAIIEYFDPLMGYLEEQNAGRSCGWD